MKKPVFPHCDTIYTISWILATPLLVNICTGCNLFSFWVSWILFFLILVLSIIRLVYGFKQKCHKFVTTLMAELVIGAVVLIFFQLSFNHVIKTPVSNPVTPAELKIAPPDLEKNDSSSKNSSKNTDKDSVKKPGKDTHNMTVHEDYPRVKRPN